MSKDLSSAFCIRAELPIQYVMRFGYWPRCEQGARYLFIIYLFFFFFFFSGNMNGGGYISDLGIQAAACGGCVVNADAAVVTVKTKQTARGALGFQCQNKLVHTHLHPSQTSMHAEDATALPVLFVELFWRC
jgi:hypothetical protein